MDEPDSRPARAKFPGGAFGIPGGAHSGSRPIHPRRATWFGRCMKTLKPSRENRSQRNGQGQHQISNLSCHKEGNSLPVSFGDAVGWELKFKHCLSIPLPGNGQRRVLLLSPQERNTRQCALRSVTRRIIEAFCAA